MLRQIVESGAAVKFRFESADLASRPTLALVLANSKYFLLVIERSPGIIFYEGIQNFRIILKALHFSGTNNNLQLSAIYLNRPRLCKFSYIFKFLVKTLIF